MIPSFPLHRADLSRRLGIQGARAFLLINCPKCHALLDVGREQQTRKCGKCGKRFWLARKFDRIAPVYSHDDREMVRLVRADIYGWWGCQGNSLTARVGIPIHMISKWERSHHAQLAERERQSGEKGLGLVPGEPTAASHEFADTLQK